MFTKSTEKKHKIQGALTLLFLELLLGILVLTLIKSNYKQRTQNDSISEGSIYDVLNKNEETKTKKKDTKQTDTTNKTATFTGDLKDYTGLFGSVSLKTSNIGNNSKDINYEISDSITIHIDKIYYYYLLKENIKQGYIDKGIVNYIIKNKDIQLDTLIKEIKFLVPNLVLDETSAYEKAKIIGNKMKELDRNGVISLLQKLEADYNETMNTPYTKDIQDYLGFTKTKAFEYVWNQLVIDDQNKYKDIIDTASQKFNIDGDLIRSTIFTEQLRGLTTYRGLLKSVLASNKYLMVMNQSSYGLGGIKEKTAIEIENRYKSNNISLYNEIFAYDNEQNLSQQRTSRLMSTSDFYYQIIYVAGALGMYRDQREKEGYDISQKIGILTTLYNIGYKQPNANPELGGANIKINGESRSFGKLSMSIFYTIKSYKNK